MTLFAAADAASGGSWVMPLVSRFALDVPRPRGR
jgi:hypothetical protein